MLNAQTQTCGLALWFQESFSQIVWSACVLMCSVHCWTSPWSHCVLVYGWVRAHSFLWFCWHLPCMHAGTKWLSPWCLLPAAGHMRCGECVWRLEHCRGDSSRWEGAEAFRVSRWTLAVRAWVRDRYSFCWCGSRGCIMSGFCVKRWDMVGVGWQV